MGEERLRITVTPRHTLEQMDKLIRAVDQIFTELKINRTTDWKAVGGRAGVGMEESEEVTPIWNDAQLGLQDGTTPRMLRENQKSVVDTNAVAAARSRFDWLLGPVAGSVHGPHRAADETKVSTNTVYKMKTGRTAVSLEQSEVQIPLPKFASVSA